MSRHGQVDPLLDGIEICKQAKSLTLFTFLFTFSFVFTWIIEIAQKPEHSWAQDFPQQDDK